jgi:hypothetical protein
VIDYVEAMLLLLPPDAGGRTSAVAPREGSYWPLVRCGENLLRARVIEGPPLLAPGDEARVVVEIESEARAFFHPGAELRLVEDDDRYVGVLTVVRVCRGAVPA